MTMAIAALGEVGAGAAVAEGATVAAPALAEGASTLAPAAARGATVAGEAAVEGAQASSFSKNLAQGIAKQALKSTGTGGPQQQAGQRQGQGVEQEMSPLPMLMSVKLPDTRAMPSTGSPEVDAMRNAAHDVVGTVGSVGKIGAAVAPFLL